MPSRVRILVRDGNGHTVRGKRAYMEILAQYRALNPNIGEIDPLSGTVIAVRSKLAQMPPNTLPLWGRAVWLYTRLPRTVQKSRPLWVLRDKRHLKWSKSECHSVDPRLKFSLSLEQAYAKTKKSFARRPSAASGLGDSTGSPTDKPPVKKPRVGIWA